MSHFLRLPLEIRNIIYEYCLVVDYVIDPYPSTYKLCQLAALDRRIKKGRYELVFKPELPTVSILVVSKQFHRETSPILYGHNHWKYPQCWANTEYYESIFDTHTPFFKHISMSFDWREGSFRMNYEMMNERVNSALLGPDLEKHNQRQESSHSTAELYLFDEMSEKLSYLVPHLNSLTIDVTLLYCPIGCCRNLVFSRRLQNDFITRLVKDVLRSNIKIVKFTGLQSKGEKWLVYDMWGFEEDGTVNRAAMAEKWDDLDFPGTWSGDELPQDPFAEPCRLCFERYVE